MTERSQFWNTVAGGGDSDTIARDYWWFTLNALLDLWNDPNRGAVVDAYQDELAVVEDAPVSKDVIVGSGHAFVDGNLYENDAGKAITIADNSSGQPRIDTIILRKTYALATQTLRLAVLQGTPSSTPSAPTLTQDTTTWEYPLADIAVANGFSTISNSDITDRRSFTKVSQAIVSTSSALVEIASGELSVAAANIDLTSIPATYRDLVLSLQPRCTAVNNTIQMRLNGDSGQSYAIQDGVFSGTSVTPFRLTNQTAVLISSVMTQSVDTTGYFGDVEIVISDYARDDRSRVGRWSGGVFNNPSSILHSIGSFGWENVADPITQITVFPASGNFDAGTRWALYGRGTA